MASILASAYGGGVWRWLHRERVPTFNAALEYLGPLSANEEIRQINAYGLANARGDDWKIRSALQDLEDRAARLSGDWDDDDITMEELAAEFGAAGFDVEIFD